MDMTSMYLEAIRLLSGRSRGAFFGFSPPSPSPSVPGAWGLELFGRCQEEDSTLAAIPPVQPDPEQDPGGAVGASGGFGFGFSFFVASALPMRAMYRSSFSLAPPWEPEEEEDAASPLRGLAVPAFLSFFFLSVT